MIVISLTKYKIDVTCNAFLCSMFWGLLDPLPFLCHIRRYRLNIIVV